MSVRDILAAVTCPILFLLQLQFWFFVTLSHSFRFIIANAKVDDNRVICIVFSLLLLVLCISDIP